MAERLCAFLFVFACALLGCGPDERGAATSPFTGSGESEIVFKPGSVAAGAQHGCSINQATGTPKCWGYNAYGQLGDGTTTLRTSAVSVIGLPAVSAAEIDAGSGHTCTVLSNGTVWCSGLNSVGQLGDNTTVNRMSPVQVVGIANAVSVATGGYHTCAALADGTMRCWGSNASGQIGDNTTIDQTSPVVVTGLPSGQSVVSLSAGEGHTCATLSDGTAWCWGRNTSGQLGNGSTVNKIVPTQVVGMTTATQISAGTEHTCAVLANGTVQCWGYGVHGALGNGFGTSSTSPVTVYGLGGIVHVSCGHEFTLALASDGTVYGWGYNGEYELGNYDPGNALCSTPNNPGETQINAATGKSCWVYDQVYGLGSGSTAAIDAGGSHGLAMLTNDSVVAWGSHAYGQLGSGAPVPAAGTVPYEEQPVPTPGAREIDAFRGLDEAGEWRRIHAVSMDEAQAPSAN
jgi:alpha-tubulin suppressor-like RCC1 family protein